MKTKTLRELINECRANRKPNQEMVEKFRTMLEEGRYPFPWMKIKK